MENRKDYRFGNFIQKLREQHRLSQYQLGMLVGVSDKAVSKWESGASKPQSRILYRLSTVLGVTVDELLAGQYNTPGNESAESASAQKEELWCAAYQSLRQLYGETPPLEVLSRYLYEYNELRHTDWILYLELLSQACAKAREMGESIRIQGGIGASLVAYIIGAAGTNPLPPHYYCPCCRRLELVPDTPDGWDLPHKYCACGEDMKRDGHNLPFETLKPFLHRRIHFNLSISHGLYDALREICSSLRDKTVLILNRREHPDLKTLIFLDKRSPDTTSSQELFYEEYYEHFKKNPAFTLLLSEELDTLSLLAKNARTFPEDISFAEKEILEALCCSNTLGISGFMEDFSPHSFHELIQLLGLAHGTGTSTWQGMSAAESIAYRDDIFLYLQSKLVKKGVLDTGIACKIMEDARCGVYTQTGLPPEIRQYFSLLGVEDWFADALGQIQYIFPKAQGVQSVRYASILMWYKLHGQKP